MRQSLSRSLSGALLVHVVIFLLPAFTHATPATLNPWESALLFDYNAASARLKDLHTGDPADARVAIGYASSLLVKQPRTQGNIREAHRTLEEVVKKAVEAPEEQLTARYLLARIEQDHMAPARLDSAQDRYALLVREHPGHLLADQAAVNLALLLIADIPRTGAKETIPHLEAFLAGVKDPGATRELHFILANVHWRFLRNAPAALVHLRAGRALGYEQPLRNADIDLSIANLARETGNDTLALAHYRAFLEQRPKDARSSTVRNLIATLSSANSSGTP